MTHSVARWAFLFGIAGLLSFACAKVEGGEGEDGSGGSDSSSSGGKSASGGTGTASGGKNSGNSGGGDLGGASSGGKTSVCEVDDEEECSLHSASKPIGVAVCTEDGWDLSGCMLCEPEAEVDCLSLSASKPDGTLVCNEDGSDWVDPDACKPCTFGGDPLDCDVSGNPTDNRGGEASCSQSGSYEWDDCTVCDDDLDPPSCADETDGERPYGTVTCDNDTAWTSSACTECDPIDYEATFDCLDLSDPQHKYHGGVALCGVDGMWDQSTCEYCGDGEVNGEESCEPGVTADTTCEQVDSDFINGSDPTSCNSACTWSTSVCSYCPGGSKCLDGGSCSASACNGKECAGADCAFSCENGQSCENIACSTDSTCDFNCINLGQCKDASCKAGAVCNFSCENGGKCENIDCTDATCNIDCENSGSVCSTVSAIVCASGQDCSFDCRNGGDCTGIELVCEAGSTCDVNCDNNGSKCLTATCESGADCTLSCANSSCPSVSNF